MSNHREMYLDTEKLIETLENLSLLSSLVKDKRYLKETKSIRDAEELLVLIKKYR